ncbi:uncharacterized protein LOC110675397 isoform X2 [Aedes aegypti]|uniref:Uncharacterized protein n=1 Tax=Aedes aegypti TaxID=7159 RepID=A0A6I8TMN5_AEDAE|nr:uncharacterized protein LOC110675397 isoform X2 [Aedes aegypti]
MYDPGGGLPPAMEKSNSCSEGNTTSVSQQNPNLAAENSGPHHHHQPHHHQQQHTSSQSSAASSAISPDLKYLHKKFKRIASATLSTVDDSGSESKKHVTSEALSRSTTINTTTATPTTIASATVDSGPVVTYPVAYLPNSKPTAVVNSAVEPSVQQQPCANNSNNEPKVGDIVNVYEATAARFRPIVEYSRTVIDRDRYQSQLQLIFPSSTDRVQQRPQLQQQSNGASLNCVNHVSGGSSTSSIISNNHIPVKLEVSADDTTKTFYPSVNNNSAINTSCDLNEKNQCSTTTVDVGNGGSSRSSSSGSALSAHELAIQADQKYVVVLQQPQPSPLYDGVSSSSVVAAPVEAVSSPAVTTTGSGTVPGKYMCPYCRLNCNKPSVLEKHIRRHTNERPFRCDPCGMAFKTKSNLYKHCRSRAHRSKFPDKDIGPTVDEDGSLGSDIEDKELSNSGSDIINRGSPMMDDRVHSPQLLVEKPYKPKFHNAALYAKFDGNKLGTSGKTVPTTLVVNSSQQHYISSLAGGGSNYSSNNTSMVSHSVPSTPHYLNGQNVESLEQHISKLISDNEAIVEVVELPLQKKYHKITGITRGISVNNSTSSSSSSSAGLDSPSSKLANALLQKRNSEELQQQQLLMLQQQHQMQQQQLQMQQQQQQVQPYPQNEPTKPKAMVAQIPYVQNHHPPVGTMEVMHQPPPQQQQPQMVARPMSANELQPQLVQYQLPLNLSKPVPSEPPPGPAVEVQVVPEPSRKRPPSESPRYSREQSPASSSSVQYQAPPSTSAVYGQQQVAPPSQPAPPASQTVPVNDHPQNPERSIIKDLLLNSREFGVVQNPENENIENLFTCKSCNTSFRDAEILKYHTICFCKGNSSSLNSPDSAPMSPIGSPSSHYMRSNRFNPNSLKNLARGLLMPPSRNPATLSKLAKSQLRQPRSRPENISLAPKEGSSSRSSSVTSTSTSHTPEVQVTPPVVAKIVDTVQNPLPSPGPLLGNTRLVDFQSSKSDTFSSKSAPEQNVIVSHVSSEDTPSRKRHIVTQDAEIRRPQHPSLQLYGGDLEVIERQEQMIPHRYSSGGTVTQFSPDADSEMNDSSMRARSSMHSGGTVVQVPKASRGASPIPMNPTTPKLVVTITPTLTPSLTTPNFFPNSQHHTPSERPNSNPNSSTVQSIGHFQFPPINSITAYNPLTLPQVSPGQASQIMHGGKMIPYVQGIPGPNSMIPSNESQMRGRPRLAPSPISIKTPPIPPMASNYKSFDPEDVVRNKKPVLAVPPVKNGMFKEIWSPAKQEINATPKKSFNFTRIADNISPRKKETIEPVKKEEIRYFNFENFISSDIIIKPNTPTESVKSEPIETKPMDVPPPPPVVQKPKFLRPNSLPLKPGTFTPKRHHGITPTHNTMPLISPETPRPSKSCRELYFNGHAYTNIGLKSSTKPFYCTVNKTQPFYVQTQKQLSMYSNWQVHPENDPHPLGFKPIQVMALYNSSQQGDHSYSIATKPLTLTVVNSSTANQPISSAIEVKSSFPSYSIPQVTSPAPKSGGFYPYLPEKSAASNDSIPPRSDSTERTLSGGFESTEEYTYVRGRGRGKYVCKECGIRCKKPSMLKKHIRTHTDVRPYSCQHCSFHFKTKGNLTKHMKSKSHFKKCTELGLNPIPTSVDDDGGDIDIENDQQSISSEQTSTIPFDSDSDPDSDGDESDDSADYSEPKGGRLPEHEAAHMLLSLSMTPPTASQATKSYPSPVSFGSANQPIERGRLPYAPTVSPGLSMSPQQQPPIQPQPAQKHLLMQTQPESSSQPHRRIITFGNTPKMEFNLLKHEQYYSDPNINKKKREYNPSVEEDDGAMPIDLTKKPKESPPLHQASYPMYHQYTDHQSPNTVPKQPLSDHPPSNLRSQVIVRVSDVVTPITGAANLLTTLVSNTDKIPLPLITNGSKELADDNVYFQEYIKQRALLDSKMKLSQMKSINNNQYEAQENHPPMEALVAQKKTPLTIAKPVPLKVTDKPYRIFNGKNEMLPKAVVEPANRIEILPIMNDPPQEPPAPKEAVRVDSTDACVEPVSTSRMETLAEVAAVSVKLDAGADSMRARSNSVISNEASNTQPSTSTPAAASSKESAKSVASEYLKLTKSVTMRKREDSESGTASDQETVAENSIIPPSIVPSIVPPVVVVPPVANPASAEHGGIVARTVIVGEDGFRKSASSEFSSINPFQEDGGRPVCEVCHKKFHKISQLKIHMNIHYMERKFRCEPCGTSFRSQGLFQKHERSATHRNKVSMTTTFGIATDSNPRPFYCKDCEVGFRIHGHLAKHLRSKMHVLKLECLGKLPFGTYTEIERSGTNLTEIDTTDCENSLSSLKRLAVRLNVKISGNVIPGGGGSDAAPSGNETDSCDDNQYENDNESNGEGDNPNHRGTEEEEDENDDCETNDQQGNNNCLKRRLDSESGGALNSDGDSDLKRPRFQGPSVEQQQHGSLVVPAGPAAEGT